MVVFAEISPFFRREVAMDETTNLEKLAAKKIPDTHQQAQVSALVQVILAFPNAQIGLQAYNAIWQRLAGRIELPVFLKELLPVLELTLEELDDQAKRAVGEESFLSSPVSGYWTVLSRILQKKAHSPFPRDLLKGFKRDETIVRSPRIPPKGNFWRADKEKKGL